MAIGDIYRLRHQQLYLGKNCETTYFCEMLAGTGGAAGLTGAFAAIVEVSIVAVQSLQCSGVQIVAENLTDPVDFHTRASVLGGSRVGEPMPPYAAWGYVLQTTDKRIRAGGKRFVGVSETDQSGGLASPGVLAPLDNLGLVLNDTFASGVNVYKIVLYTPGNIATGGLPVFVQVASAGYVRLTTQNSRKFT